MLLPQTKEREYRFRLALRIGLPIFALILAFISHTLITNYQSLHDSFFIEAMLIVLISIYFIFYLIYNGFSVKITDDVTKTFTREYLYNFIKEEIKNKKNYTLILISIDNLNDINTLYGIKNGDKILSEMVIWIGEFFKTKDIENFPIGHIKGGDFIIGFDGLKQEHIVFLELLNLKTREFKIGNIEVNISSAITDTIYSNELDYLIENLFEKHEKLEKNKNLKQNIEDINPNELETTVINAISKRKLHLTFQDIYENDKPVFSECFVKLKSESGKFIYPKTYLKVINKLELGVEFDIVILETLLQNYKHKDMIYAINILPTSLRNETFLLRVKELLRDNKIKVMFVLFEMEYYSYIERYNSIIDILKGYGVIFGVDRIASIHTSFLYLRELNIDVVRFDTYYSNKEKFIQNSNIIDGFNIIAHEKGIKSWVKNIEDRDTYTLAKKLNIDYLQGKYFSQPKGITDEIW